ncbi:nuclease [Fragilaria crotonensis]|nr:nuclease [Fragilaria crotonensis]
MSSSSLESDSILNSTAGSGDYDSDSDIDTDDDKMDHKNHRKKLRYLLYLLLIRRQHLCQRQPKFAPPRLVWTDYVSQLVQQNEFSVTFRMSLVAFNKLVDILRDDLEVHLHQALRSSKKNGPIQPELVVAMSLRWLAGGQWQDIKKVYGVSKGHFYYLRSKFMNAVVGCPTLEIRLPDSSDIEGLQRLALQFEATASSPVLIGCVGALDGLTVFVNSPTASEAENVLAYYSGHYKHDSLNVQALSDYRGKFLYFAVAAPGSFPDSSALALTRLKNWIDSLPSGFYVVADNAYIISEHVLVPFSGIQRHVPQNSSYNYFLSQLRIRVEQAFGQFSVKWRIIRKPLETRLRTSSILLCTCARLHNFIIDTDWQGNEEVTSADVVGNLNEIYRPNLTPFRSQPGTSFLRDMIVKHIEENGYRRPCYNRLRNDDSNSTSTLLNFEEYEAMQLM